MRFKYFIISTLMVFMFSVTVTSAAVTGLKIAGIFDFTNLEWITGGLTLLSSIFGWFFRNLKKAMKETGDVVLKISDTVQQAVDVFDAFAGLIEQKKDGSVVINPDGLQQIKKEIAEVKESSSGFKKELKEMTTAWGSLFKKPKQ